MVVHSGFCFKAQHTLTAVVGRHSMPGLTQPLGKYKSGHVYYQCLTIPSTSSCHVLTNIIVRITVFFQIWIYQPYSLVSSRPQIMEYFQWLSGTIWIRLPPVLGGLYGLEISDIAICIIFAVNTARLLLSDRPITSQLPLGITASVCKYTQ